MVDGACRLLESRQRVRRGALPPTVFLARRTPNAVVAVCLSQLRYSGAMLTVSVLRQLRRRLAEYVHEISRSRELLVAGVAQRGETDSDSH